MSASPTRTPKGALARGLKLIGRMAERPTWLRVSGALMRQGLQGRILSVLGKALQPAKPACKVRA